MRDLHAVLIVERQKHMLAQSRKHGTNAYDWRADLVGWNQAGKVTMGVV